MSTVSFFVDKKGEGKKRRREAREQKPQQDDGAEEEAQVVEDEQEAPRQPVSKKAKQMGWKQRAKKQKRANKATAAVMAGEEGEEEERALEDDLFGDDLKRQKAATVSRKRTADQDSEAESDDEEDEAEAVKEEEEDEDELGVVKKEQGEEEEESEDEDEEEERRRAREKKKKAKEAKKAKRAAAQEQQQAAWVDEDDEEQQIELTRKKAALLTRQELAELDKTGGKKVVSGNEYQRRLRHHAAAIRDAFVSSGVAARSVSWATAAAPASDKAKRAGSGADALEEGADDDVAALLRSTSHSTSAVGGAAAPQRPVYINVSRLRDANASVQGAATSTGAACAMQFHPRRPQLLMVATAADSCVRLFDVDGERNSMVAEARLRRLQLEGACMLGPDPTEIVAVGTQPFFYVYDLASSTVSKVDRVIGRSERAYPRIAASPSGEYVVLHGGGGGEGVVLSGRTKQLVGTVRLSSALMTSAAFSAADPNVLYASGAGGDVFAFDMRMMMRCVQRFSFSGASNTTALAVAPVPAASAATGAPVDRYMAVGSDSGVVDVFSGEEVRKASMSRMPVAAKSLMNLTTAADGAVFNPDAQLLAVWSRRKQRAFKLVHLPSCTVFSNWPQTTTPLGTVYSAAFSPNGGYLALGTEQGRALLFRMCHWPRA